MKCGGEKPSCDRCIARNENCLYNLSPTLSYTQKLEKRVKELEDLISQLQKVPDVSVPRGSLITDQATTQYDAASRDTTVPELSGTFEGLKFDDKGGITYHGATGFFHLPKPTTSLNHPGNIPWEISVGLNQEGQRKERLVNNAWQQRALENLAETPVSIYLAVEFMMITFLPTGTLSILA